MLRVDETTTDSKIVIATTVETIVTTEKVDRM